MTKSKEKINNNHDELNKRDLISANIFVALLAIGMLIAGIVLVKMTY
ncbi:hypothetical protein ACFFIS_08210 [Virgibacillus soli]|uniref:Uncharacterized protein n=1 Tax=Paracerasibacillus soli TaxID=480284 RepID=A0ABU5CUP2_9BACI|nr:hypothetical protein [Virgibacillus soli]MDY0410087.1 hypothetical protein [Virgibacillus soli]